MRQKLLAEWIGTYVLVFAGTGAIMIEELTHQLTHIGISLTFGLVVMALIYSFGHISGAHFNPAVTVAFWVKGDIKTKEAIPYLITQFVAATAASGTLYLMFGSVASMDATVPMDPWTQSFVLELILTWILMTVILGSAVHRKATKGFAGLAIGATVGLEAMFAGPISGASMNPARSFGPAIVSGQLEHLWIYLVATVIGAVLAVILYRLMQE